MPNPNAVVSSLIRIEATDLPAAEVLRADRPISVQLEGERQARLDPSNPRSPGFAQVLEGLSRQGLPVYLEIDPDTSAITRLLIPLVTRVVGIRPIDEGVLGVELMPSHARHVLRAASPDYAELEGQLREALRAGAPVLITENDAHEIIDVRGYTPGPERPALPFPEPAPRIPWPWNWIRQLLPILLWPYWPWWWWSWLLWWFRCITMTKAQQVFDAMNATSCDPVTVPAPCIPFLYPDDGCWARAHEMCRLMINMGLSPRKVWIQGNLYVNTKNHPDCHVWWGWHVAPTLCVRGPGLLQTQRMVIDPSLFTTPVPKQTWKSVQGDPSATLTDTDASDYLWGSTDPTYAQTNSYLAFYRLELQNRANEHGSPPYANCP